MNVSLIISIACAVFCFFNFFYFKRYIKRRTSESKLLDEHRTEAHSLIVEINAATDRSVQLVEDRLETLKKIQADTDKRISVYVRELEKSRNGEALYTSLGRGIRSALNTQVEPPPEKPEAPKFYVVKQDPPEPPQETAVQPPPKNQSKRQIRAQIDELIEEGFTPEQIASRLEVGIAEVSLAMNLNRQKKHS